MPWWVSALLDLDCVDSALQALEFVLNIDEQLYENLAPKKLRHMIENSAELHHPRVKAWKGLDPGTVLRFVATCTIVLSILGIYLLPQLDTLQKGLDALCGGELDFVYTDLVGMPVWAMTKNVGDVSGSPKWQSLEKDASSPLSWSAKFIDTLLQGLPGRNATRSCEPYPASSLVRDGNASEPDPDCWTTMTQAPLLQGIYSLQTTYTETEDASVAKVNPACHDLLDHDYLVDTFVYWDTIADAVRTPNATNCTGPCPRYRPVCEESTGSCVAPTCASLRDMCYLPSAAGVRVRQYCPETCGCSVPQSKQVLSGPGMGCGPVCSSSKAYREAEALSRCRDVSSKTLAYYTRSILAAAAGWPDLKASKAYQTVHFLNVGGCSAAKFWPDLCLDSGPMGLPVKPLTLYCPVSCGCQRNGAQRTSCLSSCLSNSSK